jgi:hypothetical protein
MEFIAVCVVFAAVFAGLVLIVISVVGGDPGPPLGSRFFGVGAPVIEHPPELHRLRTFLIGLSMLALAVVLAMVWVA